MHRDVMSTRVFVGMNSPEETVWKQYLVQQADEP